MFDNEYEVQRQRDLKIYLLVNKSIKWMTIIIVVAIIGILVWGVTRAKACEELIQDAPLPAELVQGRRFVDPEYFPGPGALMPVIPPVPRRSRGRYYPNPYPNNCGPECYQEFHREMQRNRQLCMYPDGIVRVCR